MPSRNSINKPKDKLQRNAHASSLGKRRHGRLAKLNATRSSTSRYNKDAKTKPSESTSLALYKGSTAPTGVLTNNTLSKKRAKKIERNQNHIRRANQPAGEVSMEEDEEQRITRIEQVKQALWSVFSAGVTSSATSETQGTTLGVQAF